MTRCAALALALAAVFTVAVAPAAAQVSRNFPATALRGEVVFLQPPELLLNGRPARLAPGARIRSEANMMVVSGALIDQRRLVHYTLDLSGGLLDVWLLNPAESARQPWPRTAEQAATWAFDPVAQTWSRR